LTLTREAFAIACVSTPEHYDALFIVEAAPGNGQGGGGANAFNRSSGHPVQSFAIGQTHLPEVPMKSQTEAHHLTNTRSNGLNNETRHQFPSL